MLLILIIVVGICIGITFIFIEFSWFYKIDMEALWPDFIQTRNEA